MDDADPTVRRATAADAAALARVYRSAYRANERLGFPAKAASATAGTVGEWIAEDAVFVASVDGRVVGGVRLAETAPTRRKLSRLGVHEDWKGEGVGTRLLDRAERAARVAGATVVWLTTPASHPFLPDLYLSRGYEVTGPYTLPYREYDEVVMEKRLDVE